MKNVRYKLLRIAYELSIKNLHSSGLLFISPSTHGKTDTLEIFAQMHSGVHFIEDTTETRLKGSALELLNAKMIIIDEPDNWQGNDYRAAAMMCKHLIDGRMTTSRTTSFGSAIPIEKPDKTAIIYACNNDQWDKVRIALYGTGFLARVLPLFTTNANRSTRRYIATHYNTHPRSKIRFKDDMKFVTRTLTSEEIEWIDNEFIDYQHKTVTQIAHIITPDVFEELRPYLVSGRKTGAKFVEEEIEFEDDGDKDESK